VTDFATFVFDHLPPATRRVLEIGCGREGGLVVELASHGYDVLGVDPEAPEGERFVRARFQEIDGEWDVVVAGRVLHHVEPLGPSLDHLASLAPLMLVDEFAWDLMDARADRWYGERRSEPGASGPEDLDQWRWRHPGLHPHDVLLRELRRRYDERALEWVPYFHHWLGRQTEADERAAIEAGELPAIGYRFAGESTSTTRSPAASR
jgi:SAM-dependent methyltransferase